MSDDQLPGGRLPDAAIEIPADTSLIAGHTLDELSDYLDRGRSPADPSIDDSPDCQIALASLERLRSLSLRVVELDAETQPAASDSWVAGILSQIGLEAHAGRDIPMQHSNPDARLVITEGAVRGLIRTAGDSVGGVLVGRCRLDGDVTVPGAPISIALDATVFWGERIPDVVVRLREAIFTELLRHTELDVVAIDITVHDVHVVMSTPEQLDPL